MLVVTFLVNPQQGAWPLRHPTVQGSWLSLGKAREIVPPGALTKHLLSIVSESREEHGMAILTRLTACATLPKRQGDASCMSQALFTKN